MVCLHTVNENNECKLIMKFGRQHNARVMQISWLRVKLLLPCFILKTHKEHSFKFGIQRVLELKLKTYQAEIFITFKIATRACQITLIQQTIFITPFLE